MIPPLPPSNPLPCPTTNLLPPIQVGWRDVSRDPTPTTFFKEELSKLVATSMTNLGAALKNSLDLLNVHRVQNGLDNYGQVSDLGSPPYTSYIMLTMC